MTLTEQPVETGAPATLDHLRATFAGGVTRPLAWRVEQLRGLVRLIEENEEDLGIALAADLGKPRIEGWLTDLAITRMEIEHAIKELPTWMRPERVKVPMIAIPGRATIHREPMGVALVIAPWNYPIQLLLLPMAAALAAGNCVVGKPSELAPATSSALADLVPRYVDTEAVAVVEGGVPETTALLAQRWDHIFYTGNGTVGRVVARAAAEHLTPVTLELGGKSPVIVDADADLKVAAKRIAWGKWLNAGQTCVAPDHLLVHEDVADELVDRIVAASKSFYGDQPKDSADYARIVNDRHFARLGRLVDDGGHTIVHGGERDEEDRYLAPTVVTDVQPGAAVMGEEIFGPILPVLRVSDVDEAIARVNAGDKPLALYAFSRSTATQDRIVARTSSGGVCINATMLHLGVPGLPFGGVGESGTGSYHGAWGFETFSHRKSVLNKPTRLDPPLTYPPFSSWKEKVLRRVL
jgi:aldehyde dehydrogenase (NAD+)